MSSCNTRILPKVQSANKDEGLLCMSGSNLLEKTVEIKGGVLGDTSTETIGGVAVAAAFGCCCGHWTQTAKCQQFPT